MHVLKFRAVDVHSALIRLMDRIRVTGAKLMAVDVNIDSHRDCYAVVVRFDVDDDQLADRLANQMRTSVGVTLEVDDCGVAACATC